MEVSRLLTYTDGGGGGDDGGRASGQPGRLDHPTLRIAVRKTRGTDSGGGEALKGREDKIVQLN